MIGLPSSGVHSNGFSLVRKIIWDKMNFDKNHREETLEKPLLETLLTPTRIYTKQVMPLIENDLVHACVHITGGGFYENIPRALPEGLGVKVDTDAWKVPEIFNLLQHWGGTSRKEMFSTFNMGVGFLLFIPQDKEEEAIALLKEAGEEPIPLGVIEKSEEKVHLCSID